MTATAIVKVHLEIKISQGWGDDCSLGQVRKQATHEADNILRKAIENDPNISTTGRVECIAVNHKV